MIRDAPRTSGAFRRGPSQIYIRINTAAIATAAFVCAKPLG
jgi:hypothetical protein